MRLQRTATSLRLTIRGLATTSGCTVETVRYYERKRLMPPPPRTAGGHRVYDQHHARRLAVIRRGRELGFTLAEIAALLGLVDGGDYTCDEVKRITVERLGEVRRTVARLKGVERVLTQLATRCDGAPVPDCVVIDVLLGDRVKEATRRSPCTRSSSGMAPRHAVRRRRAA